jgi:hypothetical protein
MQKLARDYDEMQTHPGRNLERLIGSGRKCQCKDPSLVLSCIEKRSMA